MTVASATSAVSYSGDGATTAFPITFYFLDASHVRAVLRNDSSGAETAWGNPADFAVSGAGNPAGGVLQAVAAPAAGQTLLIYRDVPATQETDYVENDPFPAESHERALDKLTMIAQQLGREIGRSFRLKISDPTAAIELPDVEARKGKYLFFDTVTGEPSVASVVTVGALVVSAFWQSVLDENNAAASRALLEAAGLGDANVFAANQSLRSGDAGAAAGPILTWLRDSASPAAADALGRLNFDGRNAASAALTYAWANAYVVDATAGSEDGGLAFGTRQNGAAVTALQIEKGLALQGAGGDPGAGKVNATGYLVGGVALPFQKSFESAEQSVVSNGAASVAHGLGGAPKLVQAVLRCKTAELGYGVGDELVVDQTYASSDGRGGNVSFNATTITVATLNLPFVANKAGGGSGAGLITAARWRWVLRAWA